MVTAGSQEHACRLCGGGLQKQFQLNVLKKYDVGYYRCDRCASLQTEKPYWLDEAYGSNLSSLDTGAAQRSLTNLAACLIVAKIFHLTNVIDYGGGDGLLCRLLRDYGINCFVKDRYASPTYAQGFTKENFSHPDMLVSFEVFEHLPNPAEDLNALFGFEPKVLLTSTLLYGGESKDWWYLVPETGQHLFFYSRASVDYIAKKYGYTAVVCGSYQLFVKPLCLSSIKRVLVRLSLRMKSLRIVRILVNLLPTKGVLQDLEYLRKKSN